MGLCVCTEWVYSILRSTVDSHLPVKSPMRSDRHCGRFFSARIRSQSKPYQRRSPMRSDHHSGLLSNFCDKTANLFSSLRSNGYFQYIVMIILLGYFILKTVTYVFHTCTMRAYITDMANNFNIIW